jgi:hypothetical protein
MLPQDFNALVIMRLLSDFAVIIRGLFVVTLLYAFMVYQSYCHNIDSTWKLAPTDTK